MRYPFCSNIQSYGFIAGITDIAFSTKFRVVLLIQRHIQIASMGNIIEKIKASAEQKNR
jgi:hypothetical protein